jgi:preprotein translocase SecE subunit
LLASLLGLFGCISLYYFVPAEKFDITPPQPTFWGSPRYTFPFFEFTITNGIIICLVLFSGIVFLTNRLIINKPLSADFLIETEYELKKVSWPPKNEYWGASVAVIISVFIIGLFIFMVDIILSQFAQFVYLK